MRASEADLICRLIEPTVFAFFFCLEPEAVEDAADSDDSEEVNGGLVVTVLSIILRSAVCRTSGGVVAFLLGCALFLRVDRNEDASITPWRMLPMLILPPATLRRRDTVVSGTTAILVDA